MKFNTKNNVLTFVFKTPKAANHFKTWLCESGEQDYWNWMEYREQEEEDTKHITGLTFEYHSDKPEIINVECGRLDEISETYLTDEEHNATSILDESTLLKDENK